MKCAVSGAVMAAVVIAVGRFISIPVLDTVIQVIVGCAVYAVLLVVLKNETALRVLDSIRSRVIKK